MLDIQQKLNLLEELLIVSGYITPQAFIEAIENYDSKPSMENTRWFRHCEKRWIQQGEVN